MAKTLVIYYSRGGQNYVNGKVELLEKGNTRIVCEFIRDAVGADLFRLETVKPYSDNYIACTEEAKKERRENARPELKEYLSSVDGYDNIVVAGPCWWGTFPMAVFSQLERLDLGGKKVFAVMTHEGSGLGDSVRDLEKACPGAEIGEALEIHGADAAASREETAAWAARCGL